MQTPIVYLSKVHLPYAPRPILVPYQTAQKLQKAHKNRGFGTLDLLLVFPEDPSQSPGEHNRLDIAVHASVGMDELILEAFDTSDLVPLPSPHEIQRVRITAFGEGGKNTSWHGPQGYFEPLRAGVSDWPETHRNLFARDLYQLLLSAPEEILDTFEEEDAFVSMVCESVTRTQAPQTAPSVLVYLAASLLLTEEKSLREVLFADDLTASVKALTQNLYDRLQEIPDRDEAAAEAVEVLLEDRVELGLQDILQVLDTVDHLANMDLAHLPPKAHKTLRSLRKELDRLVPGVHKVLAQINQENS